MDVDARCWIDGFVIEAWLKIFESVVKENKSEFNLMLA